MSEEAHKLADETTADQPAARDPSTHAPSNSPGNGDAARDADGDAPSNAAAQGDSPADVSHRDATRDVVAADATAEASHSAESGDSSGQKPASGEVTTSESSEISAEDLADEDEVDDDGGLEGVVTSGAVEEVVDDDSDETLEMDWYILKVQSNRERSIAEALQRKISVEGLDRYFDQVVVPTERVTEFKSGKKRVVERKLYPGYIVVHMHINDDTWFAVRETSGIGDFTGAAGKPTPMLPHEVARIVKSDEEETTDQPKLDIQFQIGDKVKIKEGNFESFEGEVSEVDLASGRVTVMINIFGRSTPVQFDYWHLEAA